MLVTENKKLEALLSTWSKMLSKDLTAKERLSRCWVMNKFKPYSKELASYNNITIQKGLYALNLYPEIGCTSAVTSSGKLLRTLDFSKKGLGEHLFVRKYDGPSGSFYSIGWEGFVGVCTGFAHQRFAISYNEAPFHNSFFYRFIKVPLSKGWPPMWLIRYVFETCKTYDEAQYMLCHEKLAVPAIFTLVSPSGLGCVIERTETEHFLQSNPAVGANHWTHDRFSGDVASSKSNSTERYICMRSNLKENQCDNFSWLSDPVLQKNKTVFATEIDLSQNKCFFWNLEKNLKEEIVIEK